MLCQSVLHLKIFSALGEVKSSTHRPPRPNRTRLKSYHVFYASTSRKNFQPEHIGSTSPSTWLRVSDGAIGGALPRAKTLQSNAGGRKEKLIGKPPI